MYRQLKNWVMIYQKPIFKRLSKRIVIFTILKEDICYSTGVSRISFPYLTLNRNFSRYGYLTGPF